MTTPLEVGQLWEWTEGAATGMRLKRALRIKSLEPYATATIEHWRGRPDWRGRSVLWPTDHAHHYTLVTAEQERARRDAPKKVRRKTALR